jgi:hypothetical protein
VRELDEKAKRDIEEACKQAGLLSPLWDKIRQAGGVVLAVGLWYNFQKRRGGKGGGDAKP